MHQAVDLSAWAGETVILHFNFITEGQGDWGGEEALHGAYLDDIVIETSCEDTQCTEDRTGLPKAMGTSAPATSAPASPMVTVASALTSGHHRGAPATAAAPTPTVAPTTSATPTPATLATASTTSTARAAAKDPATR